MLNTPPEPLDPYTRIQARLPTVVEHLAEALVGVEEDPGLPPAGRRAAAVLGLIALRPRPAFLFTLRPGTMRRHAGQVSFPGGRVETGESYLDAALRETCEEVGIQRSAIEVIGRLPPIWTGGSDFWVVPYIATVAERPALTISSHEVEETFWIPWQQFAERNRHTPCPVEGQEMRFVIDYWDVETPLGTRTIWGATGAMLRSFIERVTDTELPKE